MTKPVNISNSFQSFIRLCEAYSNREITMDRVRVNERELVSKIDDTSARVSRALGDDFNTSVAIDALSELVSYVNRLFQESFTSAAASTSADSTTSDLNRHYGAVMAACNYVKNTLNTFGLDYKDKKTTNTQTSSSSSSEQLDVNEILNAALRFRKNVRSIALDQPKTDSGSQLKGKLFDVCDQFREDLKRANIEFKVS